MSRSLNNAFIRAYSKEKAIEAQQQSAAQEAEADQAARRNEDFIVRFDTATCSIPEPHFHSKPRTGAAVLAGSADPKQSQSRERASEITPSETDGLREAIASQMSRAGEWGDQQIDAFIGGFPMITPLHQRIQPPHLLSSEHRQTQMTNMHPEMQQAPEAEPANLESHSPVAPSPAPSPKGNPNTVPPVPVANAEPPQLVPLEAPALVDTQPARETATKTTAAKITAAKTSTAKTTTTKTSTTKTTAAAATATAATATESERANEAANNRRSSRHAAKGEIFRLDRPSYSNRSAQDDDALSDNELSSIIGSLSESDTNLEIEAQQATSQAKQSYVSSVEDQLRRAKVRIFNPVWEVDNFQWPEVCLELLEQRAASMDKVAQNLVTACQEGLQVLAVTSPHSGAGRTTVACCLAKLAGGRGLNVAIVDGDIENPTLSYQTNLDVEQDWKTALFDQIPLEEVAVHSIDDQVTLVPLINPITHYEMSTSDNRVESMLQELSASFDLVIVDMGHISSPRSLVTSLGERGVISAVVAVVDYRSSSQEQVDACIRQIRNTGVASIGLIENFAA